MTPFDQEYTIGALDVSAGCFPVGRAEGAFRSTTNRILGLEKSRFALIALVWLFESLDEVRAINFRPLKKILGKCKCFEEPRFHFYERAHT